MPPRLPDSTREDLLVAIATFDRTLRASYNFRQNKYVVCYEGQAYPPKILISLATSRSVREFSGGEESHRYLKKRGFQIVDAHTGKPV